MRTAKNVLINMLKSDYDEGRITALQHQQAYDKLMALEDGHDILYYISRLCPEDANG